MLNRKGGTALTVAGIILAGAAPAAADDMFDVAFGLTVTTDYISRGVSQSNGNAAVQGYVELDAGIFYANLWASNINYDGTKDTEIDLAVGVTPEFGPISLDLGYVHYFFANQIGPAFGELYAVADYAASDTVTLGANVYFAPDFSQAGGSATFGELTAEVSLPANFSLSGAVGYQAYEAILGLPNYLAWDLGVSYVWNDTVTFDIRYYDSDLDSGECAALMSATACGSRVMASISIDSALSSLKGPN